MEDRDWFESRIAAESYIPDDGFTARVVGRLPKRQPATLSVRVKVLFCSGLIAFSLFLWQLLSLLQNAGHLVARFSTVTIPVPMAYLQPPMILWEGGAALILLGFAAIPFLRRWA